MKIFAPAEFRGSLGGAPHALTASGTLGLPWFLIRTVAALKTPQGFLDRNHPVDDTSRVQLGLLLASSLAHSQHCWLADEHAPSPKLASGGFHLRKCDTAVQHIILAVSGLACTDIRLLDRVLQQ